MVTQSPANLSHKLLSAIDAALTKLRRISDAASARRASPDRWSPREELGHLIDSAVNNHRRVVLGGIEGRLQFDGYDGEAWVKAHGYQDVAWAELVDLWAGLNHHLARAVVRVPEDVFSRVHTEHTMGTIGFRSYVPGEPATLADLVDDYIEHLQHHLDAIERSVKAS